MTKPMDKPRTIEESSQPAWEVARLFPDQGTWSEEEYLALDGNLLVEFSHGHVEILPMPTTSHQLIVLFLYEALRAYVTARDPKLGTVVVAPLRVRLWSGKYCEPDLVFLRAEHWERMGEFYWDGADLVMEVVSNDDRRRDSETKRREYAQAGIPEYWIVDPHLGRITVLALEDGQYVERGEFALGSLATSALLPGFQVDTTAALTCRP